MRRKRGSGSIVKRGNIYWVYHTKEGKLKGQSLHTTNKYEAEKKAREIIKELDDKQDQQRLQNNTSSIIIYPPSEIQEYNPATFFNQSNNNISAYLTAIKKQYEEMILLQQSSSMNITLDELWFIGKTPGEDRGMYKDLINAKSSYTIRNYKSIYQHFRKLFPKIKYPEEITVEVVKQYEEHLLSKKINPATINQKILTLNSIFGTWIKEGYYNGPNPFKPKKNIHKKQKLVEYLLPEQVDAICDAAKKIDMDLYLFLMIAVNTGMRKTEVLNLRWEDIDFDAMVVKVQSKTSNPEKGIQSFTPKSKKARGIPLRKVLLSILQPIKKDSGYIIKPDSTIIRGNYNFNLKPIIESTGITFTPHLLRHTFASLLAMKGVTMFKISQWLGHHNSQTTEDVYAHLAKHDDDIDKF